MAAAEGKLAVILHADVVGSTSLVRADERRAHELMQAAFRDLAADVATHRGIAHEIRGDAVVAEFARPSDAVCAAQRFQSAHGAQAGDAPRLRIGIALGEVIVADGTITGAGVVLAQRLEQLAEPGGVVVQGAVYEAIPGRLPFEYQGLGEQEVKGFDEPVRAYVARLAEGATVPDPDGAAGPPAGDDLPVLPDASTRPSIAVLPFDNLGDDSEQDYFAEGISEDITTELSRFHSLLVVSRLSAFAFRGSGADVREIGRVLGARYLLEGSVRRSGQRVRIATQLVDARSGGQIWAERFDRDLEDVFAVQDEIASTVCSTLAGQLARVDTEQAKRKSTENLTAYDYLLRGLDLHKSGKMDHETATRAVEMFSRALELDETSARAHAWLACSTARLWSQFDDDLLEKNLALVRRALELDPDESEAHRIAGAIYRYKRMWDKADFHIRRSLELNPNDAHVTVKAGEYMCHACRPHEARVLVDRAMRLNPLHPDWYWAERALADFVDRRYTDASAAFERVGEPTAFDLSIWATCLVELGETEAAEAKVAQIRVLEPGVTLERLPRLYAYQSFKEPWVLEHVLGALGRTTLAG